MRLIDADALKQLIAEHVYPVQDAFNSRDYGMFWTGGIEKAIDEQPTVIDFEKEVQGAFDDGYETRDELIVRCKDCRHWSKMTKGCARNALFEAWQENDFCCYGERRSE